MASPSPILDSQTSTSIRTIPQMIEDLSKSHEQLSTALKKRFAQAKSTTTPTQAAGNEIVPAVEPPAPTEAPEEQQGEKETKQAQEISGNIETPKSPEVGKLLTNVQLLKEALETMINNRDEKLSKSIEIIRDNLNVVIKKVEEAPAGSPLTEEIGKKYLDAVSENMRTLKFRIPSYGKLPLAKTTAHFGDRGSDTRNPNEYFRLPNLYGNQVFENSSAFREIETVYNALDENCKKCFGYFAVFPENVVLKKRFLTHWWIGEDLLNDSGTGEELETNPEDEAGKILQIFVEKGLIVPVKEEQKKVKKKFRMPPLVRSAAIKLVKEKFLNYDEGDNPIGISCNRIFLVKRGGFCPTKAPTKAQTEAPTKAPTEAPTKAPTKAPTEAPKERMKGQNLEENIETIFNVSQPFPDLALEWLAKQGIIDMRTTKVVEWLLKLKNLKVLYLGRWQSEVDEEEHVIEVESLEFLEGLKKMKELRLLSLQGIFWINKLPNSINKLGKLRVLDLKCCYNLEKLPGGIGSLKSLTHLDVTGCYMLNGMPKSIYKLTQLRVLKGFVTGKSGLNYLKGLKKLRKLSINTSRQDFPKETDLLVLHDLGEHGKLRNLSIMWAVQVTSDAPGPRPVLPNNCASQNLIPLPTKLEKLELECLWKEELPTWLNPLTLKSLKKLYIRGGSLQTLGDKKWEAAEVVRLKYMQKLKIKWGKLQENFPNLSYLQKVECPKVTFCPCDANGVWIKP